MFTYYKIIEKDDGYHVILYLSQSLTEFAQELGENDSEKEEQLKPSALKYIQNKITNQKLVTATIMLGTIVISSFPLTQVHAAETTPNIEMQQVEETETEETTANNSTQSPMEESSTLISESQVAVDPSIPTSESQVIDPSIPTTEPQVTTEPTTPTTQPPAPIGRSVRLLKLATVVTFTDTNLKTDIKNKLTQLGMTINTDADITSDKLEAITDFSSSKRIVDITGLEYCTNLTSLTLTDPEFNVNNPNALSPLQNLTKLTHLDLANPSSIANGIKNLAPLENLTNLSYLHLGYHSGITDLSPLQNMKNLTYLSINGQRSTSTLNNLAPLVNLTNLSYLDLAFNKTIVDISPLQGLTSLTSLNLSGILNNLSDLSPLKNLINLTNLNLNSVGFKSATGGQVKDYSFLTNLTNLQSLDLSNMSSFQDTSLLANKTKLINLSLGINAIRDILPFRNLTNLHTLSLNTNAISDLTPLKDLPLTSKVDVSSNALQDPEKIPNLPNGFTLTNNFLPKEYAANQLRYTLNPISNKSVEVGVTANVLLAVSFFNQDTGATVNDPRLESSLNLAGIITSNNENISAVPVAGLGKMAVAVTGNHYGTSTVTVDMPFGAATSFDVTITDTVKPTATIIPKTIKQGAIINPADLLTNIQDNDGAENVTVSWINEPDTSIAGTTSAEIKVTDRAGNLNTYSIPLTVKAPPANPVVNPVNDTSTSVSGTGEADSTVKVTLMDGTVLTGLVNSSGIFDIALPNILTPDETVEIMLTDNVGNTSGTISMAIKDVTVPENPVINPINDSSTSISGTGEAGSSVILTISGGTPITGIVDDNGHFDIALPRSLTSSDIIKVVLEDTHGNKSGTISMTVADVTAPASPVISPINDSNTSISGTGEAGSTITITISGGTPITGIVDDNGHFDIALPRPLTPSDTIAVVLEDAIGNKSGAISMTVADVTAPESPIINPINDSSTSVSGTGEAGSTIIITISGGTPITGIVDANGHFDIALPRPLTPNDTIAVVLEDIIGNKSGTVSITVIDVTAPANPVINPINNSSTSVSGTGETGSTIIITISGDPPITGIVDDNGHFDIVLPRPLNPNNTVEVVSEDTHGNKSGAISVTVADVTAPESPIINPINDSSTFITGTGEAGGTISITISGGTPITGPVNANGHFDIALPRPLTPSDTIEIVLEDSNGNKSEVISMTVADSNTSEEPKEEKIDFVDTITESSLSGNNVTVDFNENIISPVLLKHRINEEDTNKEKDIISVDDANITLNSHLTSEGKTNLAPSTDEEEKSDHAASISEPRKEASKIPFIGSLITLFSGLFLAFKGRKGKDNKEKLEDR